jgi:hypothetical protein
MHVWSSETDDREWSRRWLVRRIIDFPIRENKTPILSDDYWTWRTIVLLRHFGQPDKGIKLVDVVHG